MSKIHNQAERRRFQWYTDQHGRRWGATIDNTTGDPIGPVQLGNEWCRGGAARVPVPAKYLKTDPKNAAGQLTIDYPTWVADLREAANDYRQEIIRAGIDLEGDKFDPDAPLGAKVRLRVGLAPLAVEVALAMQQGNPWMLGLTDTVDKRLVPYLPKPLEEPVPDFGPPADFGAEAEDEAEPVSKRNRGRKPAEV